MASEVLLNRDLLSPCFGSSFLLSKMPNYDPAIQPEITITASLDDLKDNDTVLDDHKKSVYTYYTEFLQAVLGDKFNDHPLLENLLQIKYKDESVAFITRPRICMTDTGYPCLILGFEDKENDIEALKIPLAVSAEKITLEGSAINRLAITSQDVKKADGTVIKFPLAFFSVKGTYYGINISVSSDTEYFELQEAWEERDTEKLGELISSEYGASATLNKIFEPLFNVNAFPSTGVVIKITGIQEKSKTNSPTGGTFEKIRYEVDCSGFPPIHVNAYFDGQDSNDVPLNMVRTLSCYRNEDLGKIGYSDKAEKEPPTVKNPWYVHIKSKDVKRKTPIHNVLTGGILGVAQQRAIVAQEEPAYFPVPKISAGKSK